MVFLFVRFAKYIGIESEGIGAINYLSFNFLTL